MKSEQEILNELERTEEARKRMEERGEEDKAIALTYFQNGLLWALGDTEVHEGNISEHAVKLVEETDTRD